MKFTLPWGSNQAADAIERAKVMGRIQAANYRSTVHTAVMARDSDDHEKARTRLARKLWQTPGAQKGGADELLKLIISLIQNSDLTINFDVERFFAHPIKGRTYGNCWQLAIGTGAASLKERDNAENKLFSYAKPTVVKDPRYGETSGQKAAAEIVKHSAASLNEQRGVTNSDFLPGMRPKYAAVNFQKAPQGAAFKYGKDNFVLKTHVKFNATFTHFDSYTYRDRKDNASPNELATYHNMAPIVRYMENGMLDVLIKVATGQRAPLIGHSAYIEAQIHGDIDFGRDVDRIVIPPPHREPAPGGLGSVRSRAAAKNLEEFARKFDLKIEPA